MLQFLSIILSTIDIAIVLLLLLFNAFNLQYIKYINGIVHLCGIGFAKVSKF